MKDYTQSPTSSAASMGSSSKIGRVLFSPLRQTLGDSAGSRARQSLGAMARCSISLSFMAAFAGLAEPKHGTHRWGARASVVGAR